METDQKNPASSKKTPQNTPSKHNSKLTADKQPNKSDAGSSQNNNVKRKNKSESSVTKPGSEKSSLVVIEKNKGKGGSEQIKNKDESSKEAKSRNKKQTNVALQQLVTGAETKNSERDSIEVDKKDFKKNNSSDLKDEPKLQIESSVKTEAEISKSKKRRFRKKRLLETLGISIIDTVSSEKNTNSTKKRKKKKKVNSSDVSETVNETVRHDNTDIQQDSSCLVDIKVDKPEDTSCCNGNKGAVKKSGVNINSKLKDPTVSSVKKQVEPPKTKELSRKPEKKKAEGDLSKLKNENTVKGKSPITLNSETQLRNPQNELALSENIHSGVNTDKFLNKIQDSSTSRKSDIANFLSCDNVEGLFCSALLNDVRLSSHCSENEVKNFFNSYGTFSERGRTQFAAVEKLLNSTIQENKHIEAAECSEPILSRGSSPGLTLPTSSTLDKKASCDPSLVLTEKNKNKSLKSNKKLEIPSERTSEVEPLFGHSVEQFNQGDSVGNNLIFKGGICRGPIYTSPNLENVITNSVNSSQVLRSANGTVPIAYGTSETKLTNSVHVATEEDNLIPKVSKKSDSNCIVHEVSKSKNIQIQNLNKQKNKGTGKKLPLGVSNVSLVTPGIKQIESEVSTHSPSVGACSVNTGNSEKLVSQSESSQQIVTLSGSGEGVLEAGLESSNSVKVELAGKKVGKAQLKENITQKDSEKQNSVNKSSLGDEIAHKSKDSKEKRELNSELPVKSQVLVSETSELNVSNSRPIKLEQKKENMKPNQEKQSEGSKNPKTDKTREEIIAEREAKKAAKLAAKNKTKGLNNAAVSAKSTEASVVLPKTQDANSVGKSEKQIKTVTDSNSNTFSKTTEETIKESKDISKKETVPVAKKNINNTSEVTVAKVTVPDAAGDSIQPETAEKSKSELRAERRAKQEAQRAAKAAGIAAQQQVKNIEAKSDTQGGANTKEKSPKKDTEDGTKSTKVAAHLVKHKTADHRVKLFNHLYQERGLLAITETITMYGPNLHPAVMRLGMQYADRVVVGSNARCIALLDTLKQVIRDYETPPQKEFSRGLEAELKPSVAFLNTCRPLSVSMTNALRHLTRQLTQLPNNVSDSEAKKKLMDGIDTYIREQIDMAAQAICIMVQRKIANGDVILTYGCSSLLQRILLEAHASGTKFKVIVVDGRPWREGREMLRVLVKHNLDCSYVLVSAASFIMREVTKVFLGAHALLANGYVMSRVGASQIALLAHSYNVPVLVCCETHKFCERVQTDSFVYNELGNPDDLIPTTTCSKEQPLSKWKSIGSLTPLNITYDVTPPDLVTAVVTELAILPCTSVPVILRIRPSEIGC